MEKIAIGTDIGGSHITCSLFDLTTNKMVHDQKVRMAVNSHSSENDILNAWVIAIKRVAGVRKIEKLAGIGFAMPGPFDYKNGIAWFKGVHKFESLYDVNIRAELKKRLQLPEDFPVRFLNDATCFAIGEAWIGEASKFDRIIALTLGTGFGSAFIFEGLPVTGVDGIPEDGFLYQIPFQESIADDYFSTRWFLNEYYKRTGRQIHGVKELAELALKEKFAMELFQQFGQNLGTFLAPWIKKFKAGGIVLGGNISKSFPLFQQVLENSIFENDLNASILCSSLDEMAAMFGSAKLCDNQFYMQLFK